MADDITPLASLSLTHVYYNPSDPLSLLSAYLALLPQALIIVYTTLLLSTREAEVALTFAGQLVCEALNFALKRLIKEERPRHILDSATKGYGMPSSHAQFVAFWAVTVGLFLLVRHRPGERRATREKGGIEGWMHGEWGVLERAAVSGCALGLAGAVAWSRIYLGYHTEKQVVVGWVAGVVIAIVWYVVTTVVREFGLLEWALELPVARWFRLRDLVVEEDLCQAGWEKWEGRREAAKRKKTT
ncbi:phosphatidic acid phosphatase type 2/haloperoxidase [Cercophora newfieldiana]|uniref:Dolichyldiphosphatase n=1 Tax=Cercophora newfieldiana TaxID=92897 RepID=A0AA39XT80_9PEZI|nr:phosphatidic acid phosphatase type 2/haloperoxidase [Cercophora newfieldiana]